LVVWRERSGRHIKYEGWAPPAGGGHYQAAGGRGDHAAKRTSTRWSEHVVTRAAEDGWKRMFDLDTGAARPEAPEAKEPCQRCVPACDTAAKRGRCMTAGTVLRSLRSNTVSGLARVLAEGAKGRPFFLPLIY